MTKIQIDIPDEMLERARHAFEMRVGSKIPIANRHLIQWCVEQYMRGIPETIERTLDTIEEMPETRGAHEETPVRTPSIPDTVSDAHRTHVEISRESPRETPKHIPPLEEVLDEIDRHAAMNSETIV